MEPTKKVEIKPSKTIQTSPNDSDIFYDIPDENDSINPKSSNRSRTTTTENDRYRDHTNLSHEPNIDEAPAGQCPIKQQQQLQTAGQRQTYQAKDNNDNNDGNKQNKEGKRESSLETYFTPSGSCLCSNDDGFYNFASSSSEAAASSIVKLSFSTTECTKGLQGTYECVCTEKGDKGSCHKFWCQSSKKKFIEDEKRNEKTDYEGLRVGKNLLVSCINEDQSERSPRNGPMSSSKAVFHTEQKGLVQLFENSDPGIFQKSDNSSKSLYKSSEGRLSNKSNTEDLCPNEDFEGSRKEEAGISKNSKCSGAIITPRDQQNLNEDIIPLLKSIYDVLQTMRNENLHLGPISSKNIDIHEPFNALPSPPTVPPPPSSPKYRKQLLRSSIQDLHLFKEEPINIEDNLTVLEPPERDVEDYQQSSTTSQRLIPVDMDLLRTDEELIWEPDSNSNEELKVEEEVKNINDQSLKAQFRQFSEETYSELVKELKVRQSGSSLTRSSTLEEDLCDEPPQLPDENSEVFARKPSNTQNSSEDTPILKKSSHQASQAVQVNLATVEKMSSHSAQFLRFDNPLEEQKISEEKLLKTFKETLLPTKVDIGTDCPDFDNIHRTSSNQEPIKPQDQEMTNFIESILLDLKAMESARKTSFSRLPCPSPVVWQKPSKDLSYPATIETVQELGANSLFVKWRVQNLGNIGGYELFLDGNLTNRYFNCIHRAAVICDVNLQCSHRITLRAQPLLPPRNTISSSCLSKKSHTTHPEASCPQLDGSVWYPSVYHFEPNSSSAPQNAVLY